MGGLGIEEDNLQRAWEMGMMEGMQGETAKIEWHLRGGMGTVQWKLSKTYVGDPNEVCN